MEIDQTDEGTPGKNWTLRDLAARGSLRTSIGKLSGSSRIISSQKDFHFYNNFPEFKNPVRETGEKSKNMLIKIGASEDLLGKAVMFPPDEKMELDDDVANDWLENVNDNIFEKFDVSLDEFKKLRKKEEESGVRKMRVNAIDDDSESGFQMVCGKKSKKFFSSLDANVEEFRVKSQEVRVAEKVKPKVPFHIPTIPRPQDEYKIIVNNLNQPFEHVWLDRSEDGSTFVHCLEKLSVIDFVDKNDSTAEAIKPSPIALTPFKLVEDVNELRRLALKLANVKEFAVDLEHNHYRSFQGLTCLMQISTRTEDFVIDTLKLRVHIGPYLRSVFKDPTKRKVMHGADRDILWLQRDFSIYVCNMFDTGQASRVLKMERNSLEYLLNHFCGVAANKEYQNADWRLRPLPHEMIAYAREDTHYLLYIYDVLRQKLLMSAAESENSDPPLTEVYKRSYDICCQLYEKELLTDNSYLYIYGLQDAVLNAKQLAVVSGLYEWRDVVARAEDESTGYVLPNRTLLELAKQMPVTASKLRHGLRSKHPYIERNIGSVVSIIKHAIRNASAYEEAVEHLKARRLEMVTEENSLADDSELSPPTAPEVIKTTYEVEIKHSYLPNDRKDATSISSVQYENESHVIESSNARISTNELKSAHRSYERNGNKKSETDGCATNVPGETLHESGHPVDTPTDTKLSPSAAATIPTLKKPSRAFEALFGNSAKRKYIPDKIELQDTKLEQIKSTVSLPFHIFSGRDERFQSSVQESSSITEVPPHMEEVPTPVAVSITEDVINLGDDSDKEESAKGNPDSASNNDINQLANNIAGSASEIYDRDEPMSLSDLSSGFQKFFASQEQPRSSEMVEKSQPSVDFEPFNYAAARKQVKFGNSPRTQTVENEDNARNRSKRAYGKKSFVTIESPNVEEKTDVLPQGRRRQAFPASGNRSATFR
ncbi:protein RRP6-like 2 isoform X1 [Primulina eburnea]|uniref:protein RRP6-like 2 isoform X1 n=1 Tax=Primulina eburnea TaxID=1245227 RepID=UPI003C6C3C82